MKRATQSILTVIILWLSAIWLYGQENLPYQKPDPEILDLIDVPLAPSVMMDESKEWMILRYRDPYKTIQELSQKELRLAGLRINPVTHIGSRENYFNNIEIKHLAEKEPQAVQVKGLPENALLTNFAWSPDQTKLAFTHTTQEGVEVWVLDIPSATASRITGATVNANMRDVIN
jgi:hypothetical protein